MKFENKNMSVIAYANGFTLWHYSTQHNMQDVERPGYFPKGFAALTANGDIMIVNPGDGGAYFRRVLLDSYGIMSLTKLND